MNKAVALPDLEEEEEQTDQVPKLYPMYLIIVYNDDDHTFEYVIDLFMTVFRYPTKKCSKMATHIHTRGLAIVWNGTRELGELKVEQIRNGGPDLWSPKRVDYPLKCELKPAD